MPPNSEIEKLERRWKENPKGTVFAPYAEVLRKHGDYPMAKDILRAGLEQHPDHIPGNIVLGRCCLDLGEEGPAEAAFVHVLDLDAENVIALKALADITERQGRLMEAASWLSRLISVDPSNDEAREQLTRVAAAREAASAALVAPPVAEPQRAATTEVLAVIQPPTPKALEVPETEIAAGEVGGEVGFPVDADAAVEAALGHFGQPATPPPRSELSGSEATERVAVRPRPEPVPPPQVLEIIPGGLDLAAISDIETQSIPDLSPDEPFQPPADVVPRGPRSDPFSLGLEEPSAIDLRSSGHTEFQSPDDSAALLDLSLSPSSEFQQPDASQELRLSTGRGSEYQTPSGAEELLKAVETGALLSPEGRVTEPPAPPPLATSGFAAISLMTTEELPTRPEEVAGRTTAPLEEAEPTDTVTVVEMLAAAGASAAGVPAGESPAPPGAAESATAEGEITEPAGSAPSQDLHLIFPDDAAEPEPPKVRRISDEIGPGGEPETVEPTSGEPAPVLTETMAELYARQGHLAEALNVYRGLAIRTPNDPRLAQRIRELEAAQAAGSRRMSYVAVDTGGESVESFFRSLTDARPAGAGSAKASPTAGPGTESSAAAAPTRPANDPVSLSAIFGEDSAASPSPGSGEGPRSPSSADSFSFDQFFGAGGASPTGREPRAATPSDEDIDQFQNWLKSLKR
jgi:tetratricopeptide (TPR) repeat protein